MAASPSPQKGEHVLLLPLADSSRALPPDRPKCRISTDPLPFWPEGHIVFDMFFFRKVFLELEKRGYSKSGKVHFSVLRNVSTRLLDAIGSDGVKEQSENGFFARRQDLERSWYTWKDMLMELKREGHPRAPVYLTERIFLVLDQPESCRLAKVVSVYLLFLIVSNLTFGILRTSHFMQPYVWLWPYYLDFCVMNFSLEYFIKLVCCWFVRLEAMNTELLLSSCVPSAQPAHFGEKESLSGIQRLTRFFFTPANLIDLVSILPWWITHLAVALPASSTSFLRVVRLFRIVRIFKTGRYVQNLQVLGQVMVNSGRSISILMLFIGMVALVGGVLLSNFEEQDFESIPMASYWAFAQLIALKNTSFVNSQVQTTIGAIIAGVLVSLKAVLWILPIGQIKAAFDNADKEVKDGQQLRETMEFELTRPEWTRWWGLSSSTRVHFYIYSLDAQGSEKSLKFVTRQAVPAPVLETREIVHPHFEIPLDGLTPWWQWWGAHPSLEIEMTWRPSEQMQQAPKPAMPNGVLRFSILRAKNFPGGDKRWRIKLSIPARVDGDCNDVSMDSVTGGCSPQFEQAAMEFEIKWDVLEYKEEEGSGERTPAAMPTSRDARRLETTGSMASVLASPTGNHDISLMDTVEFNQYLVTMMQKQYELLQRHGEKIESLEAQLQALQQGKKGR